MIANGRIFPRGVVSSGRVCCQRAHPFSLDLYKPCLAIFQFCQSMPGTAQGQSREKQGQAGTKWTFLFHPCLSLLVSTCPCLSLSVHACPCLSLPVPVCPCLPLPVPACPCLSLPVLVLVLIVLLHILHIQNVCWFLLVLCFSISFMPIRIFENVTLKYWHLHTTFFYWSLTCFHSLFL